MIDPKLLDEIHAAIAEASRSRITDAEIAIKTAALLLTKGAPRPVIVRAIADLVLALHLRDAKARAPLKPSRAS